MASNNTSLCSPTYFPDAGHEDKAAHSSSSDGVFIAVVARDWKGIVSSTETRDAKLRLHPGARAFAASTWAEISTLWAGRLPPNTTLMTPTSMALLPSTFPTLSPAHRAPSSRVRSPVPRQSRRSRGAELIFTHEEQEIWQFVEEETARMLKGKGSM
ncbi:hypothetical protein R3P38DRAFT_2800531 [Favolaschia claudopus]|uniref:Uncharacterized protein n=1 Tax=Favolaschia claudopus TaxID=2862362 RepID=A0AAV9ZX01_9AGAR